MNKALWVIVLAGIGLVVAAKLSQAATWKDDNNQPMKAGSCTLVDTKAEADTTHVYTLNPSNTLNINRLYVTHWTRDARCDEIRFHVDHNTSSVRLDSWLSDTAMGWYKNIGATHFRGHTVSTSQHEWFYIDTEGAHRIPDWLTASAWGLLIDDRISIPVGHTATFYKYVKIASPIKFQDGMYATKMNAIWKNSDRDFSVLPSRFASEITWANGTREVFTQCNYNADHGDPRGVLLDWHWMKYNPGCPLAQ